MSKSLKTNYLYNSLYQILSIISPLLTAPYLSRVLGPEKIGTYAYAYSISYYFMLIAMLGINNYGNRCCAIARESRDELSKTFWEIYTCQLSTGLMCVIIYSIYAFSLSGEIAKISIILILNIISSAIDINWFFFGLEEFKLTTIRNMLIKVALLGTIFIFVKTDTDLWKYTLIMSLCTLLSQIVLWPYLIKKVDIIKVDFVSIVKHIRPILVLFIPVIAVSLYKVMDKIMLGCMSGMIQTGYYENTEKLINMPLSLINALGIVMLPRMSKLVAENNETTVNKFIDISMLFVAFLSVAMTFGLASIAPDFVPLFFGEQFNSCIPLIITIAPTMIFFSYANVIRTQYLLPKKKDDIYIKSVLFGAVVNFLVNYILIPRYEAMGAVIGTLLAEATVCICQMYLVRKELNIKKYIIYSVPFVLVGCIMAIIVRYIGNIIHEALFKIFSEISIGIIIYTFISYLYLYKYKRKIIVDIK